MNQTGAISIPSERSEDDVPVYCQSMRDYKINNNNARIKIQNLRQSFQSIEREASLVNERQFSSSKQQS